MNLQVLVDMNMSVEWTEALAAHGFAAVHWSSVGDPRADDATIMTWARDNGRIVLTHDLDFGTTLSLTLATGPSVLQVRTQSVLPEDIAPIVVSALRQHAAALVAGALVVVGESKSRVRVLPLPDRGA